MSSQSIGVFIILIVSRLSQTSLAPDYKSRCVSFAQEKISDKSVLNVDQILINNENACQMICKTRVLTIIPKPLDGVSDQLISEHQVFAAVLEDNTSCGDNKICRDGKCTADSSVNDSIKSGSNDYQSWLSHLMLDRKKRQSTSNNNVTNSQSYSLVIVDGTTSASASTAATTTVVGKR